MRSCDVEKAMWYAVSCSHQYKFICETSFIVMDITRFYIIEIHLNVFSAKMHSFGGFPRHHQMKWFKQYLL